MILQPRTLNFIAFVFILVILAITLFVQFGLKIAPCPLCIFQRLAIIGAGLIFLLAFLQNPRKFGIKFYAILSLLFLIVGAVLSARHIWLQNAPLEKLPTCGGASLEYMLQVLPLSEIAREIFNGSGDCIKKDAVILGLSMPFWALAAFLGLSFISLTNLFNKPKKYANDLKLDLK